MTHVGTSYLQSMINTTSQRDQYETMISSVEVFMPLGYVMAWRMIFGKTIRFVGFAWAPVNEEVSLACLILDSIESHVH